ncbi:MAG: DUF393 domain-containing protein [Thaumarchaeota archaeon]|nr:DUF393 domain-containing protein [Nitrososphaerota archaeon]
MSDHRDEQRGVAYLLYDANCGPCARFRNVVVRLDVKHRLIPIPLQSGTAYELVRSQMTRARMMRAFHIVYSTSRSIEPTGERDRIFDAGDALIQLIRLLPLGSYTYWVAVHFRPFRTFIRWLYSRMAELRTISVSCKLSP